MTKEFNKIEFNKNSLEFLGYEKTTPIGDGFNVYRNPITKSMIDANLDTAFFESWDFIMTLIEKIEWLDWFVLIDGNTCKIYRDELNTFQDEFIVDSPNKKDAVVLAIWEFLNWYNENKKS